MSIQFLTFACEIAIPLIFSAISLYLLPFLTNFINEFQLNHAVFLAVEAVEQYMDSAEGDDKKTAVENYILNAWDVDIDQLDMLIESAVFEMNKLK